jgi:hypothetical protein
MEVEKEYEDETKVNIISGSSRDSFRMASPPKDENGSIN